MNDDNPVLPRRTRRGEERCERVRDAAALLFLARGYDGVSLDDIIAHSGGSKSNIYRRFGGKEGLFIATVEWLCDKINASVSAVDVSGTTIEEGLARLGRALLAMILEDSHLSLYRLIVGQSGRFPGIGDAWSKHGPMATRQTLTAFFSGHRDRLRDIEPEQAAHLFHGMLIWEPLNAALFGLGPGVSSIDAKVDQIVALFVRGYLRPAPTPAR